MAKPPSSIAEKPASAPESFPIGVRAPATMTASAMTNLRVCTGQVTGRKQHPMGQLSSGAMSDILHAVLAGATPDELAALPMPESFRGAVVRRDEVSMFDGMESAEKDPRKSLHVQEVPLPELAPDEAYVAVLASSINFNTVWTSIFEPLPTFGFLDRLAKEGPWAARHALDYHVVGSDAAGVVLRTGDLVRNWKPGDKVTVHCNYVDDQDPSAHDDSMLGANQRIWGFESNFGGLADITVVKANQLMPKPAPLSWEEGASNALCNSTSYRMLVSPNGARMTQGDKVLVWGASGGLGSFAVQYVLNGGGTPIGVVSSPEKVALLNELGVEAVIDRRAANYQFWSDAHTQDESEWRRLGKDIRGLGGAEPEIVFEHPGRQTMGASVFACKRGGKIGTRAATLRRLPMGAGRRGGLPGPSQPARRQDRRPVPGTRRRPRHRRSGAAG